MKAFLSVLFIAASSAAALEKDDFRIFQASGGHIPGLMPGDVGGMSFKRTCGAGVGHPLSNEASFLSPRVRRLPQPLWLPLAKKAG